MSYVNPTSLVSTDWLAEYASAPDVRIVDASWHMPAANRNPRKEYEAEHIPGAVFFDIDEIADLGNPLPHMVPSPEKFASRMRKLGLGDGNRIVVYDSNGVLSATRAWWMLRFFGHQDVAVLEQVFDARSAGRFEGTEAEPREGLASGHIPGSKNLPHGGLFNPDGTLLEADALKAAFETAGMDFKKPVITTCGSGISACVLAFGLHLLGHQRVAVYDGSWTEWGSDKNLPVATGE